MDFAQLPEGTWNGLKLMILSSKLRRIYSTNLRDGKIEYICGLCGEYFMFDDLYDYLTQIGFEVEVDKQAKPLIWEICKNNAEIRRLQGNWKLENKKEYQVRLYKSEIVYLYLVLKFNEGQKLELKDLQGNKIAFPSPHPEHENLVNSILETRTLQLI